MRSKPTSFAVLRIASHVTSALRRRVLHLRRDGKRLDAVALPEMQDRLFDARQIAGALRARGAAAASSKAPRQARSNLSKRARIISVATSIAEFG